MAVWATLITGRKAFLLTDQSIDDSSKPLTNSFVRGAYLQLVAMGFSSITAERMKGTSDDYCVTAWENRTLTVCLATITLWNKPVDVAQTDDL